MAPPPDRLWLSEIILTQFCCFFFLLSCIRVCFSAWVIEQKSEKVAGTWLLSNCNDFNGPSSQRQFWVSVYICRLLLGSDVCMLVKSRYVITENLISSFKWICRVFSPVNIVHRKPSTVIHTHMQIHLLGPSSQHILDTNSAGTERCLMGGKGRRCLLIRHLFECWFHFNFLGGYLYTYLDWSNLFNFHVYVLVAWLTTMSCCRMLFFPILHVNRKCAKTHCYNNNNNGSRHSTREMPCSYIWPV